MSGYDFKLRANFYASVKRDLQELYNEKIQELGTSDPLAVKIHEAIEEANKLAADANDAYEQND